ncbi:purple acid phosphatase family protein [Cyclobacterium jeungdonense]|uniref:Metallophosphoesterase family protein n=1 Tax=Cyclobacterium jeungdonense TaxID=708087 RepID=A0ABT8CBL8_9BACT|nr:metallophosphoesterase family protein [Cyclobacterium jeungdonense]MDN3690184.1 metallophosphoesterase family protein [Cyclobacterium jeungdonense]
MQYRFTPNLWLRFFIYQFLFVCLAAATAFAQTEPAAILLTWQQDPSTTISIDWHTLPESEALETLSYRCKGKSEWQTVRAQSFPFPYSDRRIHRMELTGLDPDSNYEFRVGEFQRVYSFRTLPARNDRPLRFAAGGDTSHGDLFRRMNRAVMRYDPDFIVWGGDLAYANGNKENVDLWYQWFDGIRETLISEEGRVVPVIVGLGNHDVINHHYPASESNIDKGIGMPAFIASVKRGEMAEPTDSMRLEKAPFFYPLFAFPGQPGYGVLDIGNYLSLIILDSSHSNLISGSQTDWLKKTLQDRQDRPHLIPVYHKPAYPSGRVEPGGKRVQFWSEEVLDNWIPLFEEYAVRVALENDDHTYKRSYPVKNNAIRPNGIVYLGDGSWGVEKKKPKTPEEVWYLSKSAEENSAIIVTLQGSHQHFLMINENGKIIDEYPETLKITP